MKKIQMKSRVFLILVLIILLIMANLSLSLMENRYTSGPIYKMMDEFYRNVGFIDAFDECEKRVTSYRWSDEGWYDPEQDSLIREQLSLMRSYLDSMVSSMSVDEPNQYHDIRALNHMFPHYEKFIEDFLKYMENGERTRAVSVYYQRETIVTLIHDYSSQMLNDTVQESQNDYAWRQKITKALWLFQVLTGFAAVMLSAYFVIKLYEIVQPINYLVKASEAMRNKDFDIADVPENVKNEEMRQLMISFNHMKHSMKRFVEMLKEHNRTLQLLRETEKRALESQHLAEQAKLLNLRGQVNPHFLFNALNTIRRIAQQEKAPQTEALILSLSKIFRHSLYNNEALATLSEEIEVTKQYLKIQKARFGDRIHLEWNISEQVEADELLVPSFVLQTLVENAVKHGLEPRAGGGKIKVCLELKNEMFFIRVLDNGSGMTQETLERVRKGERPPGTDGGIGLNNVYHRLQLLDKRNELIIQSKKEHGTQIIIKMPVQYRKEERLC